MSWKHIFARKDLETLLAEAAGEHRLRRVLGPVALTSLGIGCIIGAGIFVMTGRAAALDAGPAVIVSYAIAGLGCALAALCYAEFAAMAPVAGSAYTYAYTTLGEIFAWIIGWDLILEYAMGCATVASAWTKYFNELLEAIGLPRISAQLSNDPFTADPNGVYGIFNLPSVLIMALVTIVLVVGIRESARTNATLVMAKLAVVLFVIAVGWAYVTPRNWTGIPVADRALPQEKKTIPDLVAAYLKEEGEFSGERFRKLNAQVVAGYRLVWQRQEMSRLEEAGRLTADEARRQIDDLRTRLADVLPKTADERRIVDELVRRIDEKAIPRVVERYLKARGESERFATVEGQLVAEHRLQRQKQELERLEKEGRVTPAEAQRQIADLQKQLAADLPQTAEDRDAVDQLLAEVNAKNREPEAESWGLLGMMGLNRWLIPIDDSTRSPFMPYGLSGIMLGASIVFFAFIGFDSISTHAEEARRPQRDVPIGILVSLSLCTVLYILVAAVVTGMEPYPDIDTGAPIAAAFTHRAAIEGSSALKMSGALIAIGGLAGMTSVLLVLFLSQARIFMAMSRDGLLPQVFGTVHPRFRTPHIATMVTGVGICLAAALTPIVKLEEMVNVGTLLAFVMVCAAVLILRIQRPAAHRPFVCPALWIVGPLGIVVNLTLMLFLPLDTWLRLVIWLGLGLVIYFVYSRRHSLLTRHLLHEVQMPREEITGTQFDPEEVDGK